MNVTEKMCIEPNDEYALTLPIDAKIVIDRLNAAGMPFTTSPDKRLGKPYLESPYVPGRIDQVRQIVAEEGWDVKVDHGAHTTFTDEEWEQGAFRTIFPYEKVVEPELDYHTLEKPCSTCGRKWLDFEPIPIKKKYSTKHRFLTPGAAPDIAATDIADELADKLIGIRLEPFDEEGRFKYIVPEVTADPAIVHDGDMIGYKGMCEECDRPIRDIIIGPIRYSKEKLKGLDVAHTKILDHAIYSPRAVELIRSYEDDIVEDNGALFLLE